MTETPLAFRWVVFVFVLVVQCPFFVDRIGSNYPIPAPAGDCRRGGSWCRENEPIFVARRLNVGNLVSRIEHMDEDNGQQALGTDFLAGGGELGELIRRHDWSATPLGPISIWPPLLRSMVGLCVKSRVPIAIHWGWPDLIVLYNDALIPIIGDAHPNALGRPLFESWPDLRATYEEIFKKVLSSGDAALLKDMVHVNRRCGYLEERYFTVSLNPILLESGKVGGCFTLMEDTAARVVGERRQRTLRDLADRSVNAKDIEEACRIAGDVLAENRYDVPFALLYVVDKDRKRARLVASVGLNPGETASPSSVDLTAPETGSVWPVAQVAKGSPVQTVDDLEEKFGPLPGGPWDDSPRRALVLPIIPDGLQLPDAVLVAGISPRRPPDDAYLGFLN